MYSISSSLFLIFSLMMVSVQLLLSKLSYDYPKMGFIIITIVSILIAVYYYLLDYHDRKNSKG